MFLRCKIKKKFLILQRRCIKKFNYIIYDSIR